MRNVPRPNPGFQMRFEGEEVGHILGMAAMLMATGEAAATPGATLALAAQYYLTFRELLKPETGVADTVDGRRYRIVYCEGVRSRSDGPSLVVDVTPLGGSLKPNER